MRALAAIGVPLMMMSSFLIWIEAPISKVGIGSDQIIFLPWNLGNGFVWVALLIGLIGGVAWFFRSGRLLAVCGVAGLGLCSFSILHLTFLDSSFWSLVDENAQYAQMMNFSRRYLPANLGIEPAFEAHLLTNTVTDRLATAFYFMGWGWRICFVGSLLVLFGCFKIEQQHLIRWTAIAATVIFASQGIILFKGFAAEYQQEKGNHNIAHGRYAEAIQRFMEAQQFDPQLARSERFYLRLGEAYYHLGISSHPYVRFYLGDYYSQQKRFDVALFEYRLAETNLEAVAPFKEIILQRIAWTYVNMGLSQYRKGNIGRATGQWERALALDPTQFQAAYFLTRAYFDQGRYEQSIAMGRFLLPRSQNRILNANVEANIGDAHWKLNDSKSARIAYEASMRQDSYRNFRIFKSLGGT